MRSPLTFLPFHPILLLSLLLLLLTTAPRPTLANRFADSCADFYMFDGTHANPNGHLFRARCLSTAGADVWSDVHLNERLGVDDRGRFVWGVANNHRLRCRDFFISHIETSVFFNAICGDVNWKPVETKIDLNEYMTNNNGHLSMD